MERFLIRERAAAYGAHVFLGVLRAFPPRLFAVDGFVAAEIFDVAEHTVTMDTR